jgi:hypothetical protein
MKTILPSRTFDDAIEMIESLSDSAAIRRYFEEIEQGNNQTSPEKQPIQESSTPEKTASPKKRQSPSNPANEEKLEEQIEIEGEEQWD